LGFKSLKTAYATLKGFEVMRALKGQGALRQYQDGTRGEVCLVERAFGLGPSGLAEAEALLDERLRRQAPKRRAGSGQPRSLELPATGPPTLDARLRRC
jgi:hypothetical protein